MLTLQTRVSKTERAENKIHKPLRILYIYV